jgi:predicted transcriptional regulator YdeE
MRIKLREFTKRAGATGILSFSILLSYEVWAKSSILKSEKEKTSQKAPEINPHGQKVQKITIEPKEESWEKVCISGSKSNTVPQDVATVSVQNLERTKTTLLESQIHFMQRPVIQYFVYEESEVTLAAGYFVDCKAQVPANLQKFEVDAGLMIFVEVDETPEESGATHQLIHQWIKEKGREITGAPIEIYEAGPFIDLSKNVKMKIVYPVNTVSTIQSK